MMLCMTRPKIMAEMREKSSVLQATAIRSDNLLYLGPKRSEKKRAPARVPGM